MFSETECLLPSDTNYDGIRYDEWNTSDETHYRTSYVNVSRQPRDTSRAGITTYSWPEMSSAITYQRLREIKEMNARKIDFIAFKALVDADRAEDWIL